ncbi:beta-galactosidase BgaS [Pseudothermotoga thermarum]|uniref:Glycoside hydrolase family 1 n=1 Tax=Pseudothermotoga thermarum DSM 5069 TaxID=688269 RepID=F7YX70_9THEM|nr:beta-galactosidase BgaS [Pseudothermotoga thermarum]AEH51094.1 glycoside hydrolase family 1 [Pseudothermotoga thermarum DSM 5069]
MFPKDFLFGASMAGFQVEMGYGKDDVDPNTDWFVWVREPENLFTGTVSGHLPEYGVGYWKNYANLHQLAVDFGMNCLRVNVEWSRIFPKPTFDVPVHVVSENGIREVKIDKTSLEKLDEIANKSAVEHYREIFKDMKSRGLRLILNLAHFTLPIWIHDPMAVHRGIPTEKTGWVNEKTVVEFAKFAAYVAWKFDDLVDMYTTMNEPNVVSQMGYIMTRGGFPPSYFSPEMYLKSLFNQAQAHARAYDAIKFLTEKPVGIIYASSIYETLNGDKEIEENAMYMMNYMFLDSIINGSLLFQDRPDMREKVDFLGVNYYTRTVIERIEPMNFGQIALNWKILEGYGYACPPGGFSKDFRPVSDFGWETYPEGLLKLLRAFYERYKLPLMVTENGVADCRDWLRPYHLVGHLYAVEKAIEDGIDVRGYLHWSIVDNYEWARGYTMRFGLAETDYETKQLTPRPSMYIFREIVKEGTTARFHNYLKSPYEIWRM